jgi:transposase
MRTYVGIDVSKLTLDVAALLSCGEIMRIQIKNTEVGHESLMTWLSELDTPHIILEATGSYHQKLIAFLQAQGKAVSVVNPRQSNDYAKSLNRRNKTDAVDALMLAGYGRERQPQVHTTSHSIQQSLAREIEALTQDITRLKNRLEAASHGLTHPEVRASLQRRIKALEAEKKLLEEQLEQQLKQQQAADLALLETIPGIGKRSACFLLAELGDIRRFDSSAALVAFAGLNPGRFESGSSVHKQSAISRKGSPHLRHWLYMPSVAGLRCNPLLKSFYQRLTSKGKAKMVALTACMAKLLKIIYGVLSSAKPFNPDFTLDKQHSI